MGVLNSGNRAGTGGPVRTADPGSAPARPGGRLGRELARADAAGRRTLVVYLTVGDPLTDGPPALAPVLTGAGVDVLELGLPTPNTRPRGGEIAGSFRRAGAPPAGGLWRRVRELRAAVGDTPVIVLAYPPTISDLGWPALLAGCRYAVIDGIVLTEPSAPDLERISGAGMSAIPLIRPELDREMSDRWERHSCGLVYRTLGDRTGEKIDAGRAARRVAAGARVPFLAGFGIRNSDEIRTLVPSVAGVVIGSELLRLLRAADPTARPALAAELAARWHEATRVHPIPGPRLGHHGPGGLP